MIDAGSSPHTRGAPDRYRWKIPTKRIIPAYAGSTACRRFVCRGGRDHPRIRGEHNRRARCVPGPSGSSPHTRGARRRVRVCRCRIRIIPAYAGSTRHVGPHRLAVQDHPRIRGEHVEEQANAFAGEGSSPHTRGAPAALLDPARRRRIIPAYAGSTRRHWRCWPACSDHPRIRGEH